MNVDSILRLLGSWQVWLGFFVGLLLLVAFYIFSAWVGAMEMPTEHSSPEYRRKFKFYNLLAANLKRAAKVAHIPINGNGTKVLTEEEVKKLRGDDQ
jgi:hypothetical protein